MSFTRVNPGSWAIGDPLTSAQMNALDIDHSKSLDKSTAGDTIAGTVGFTGAGKIQTSGSGQIVSNSSNGILTQVTGGLQVAAAGAISTSADGGIALNGSAADWITYGTGRVYEYHQDLISGGVIVGPGPTTLFSYTADNLSGLAASVNPGSFPIHGAFENSTLIKATLYFAIGTTHGSVPAQPMKFGIFARSPSGNVGIAVSSPLPLLSSGSGYVSFTAGSGPAYFAGGVVQALDFVPNQNNVIDIIGLRYFISLIDESGTGSIAGNIFLGVRFTFNNILSSQPG